MGGVVPGSRRFAHLTVIVSVFLHASAGLGLLAVSFWNISKLTPKRESIVLRTGGALPAGDPAPAQAAPSERKPKRVVPRTNETVQPQKQPAAVISETSPATGTAATATGTGGGTGGGGGIGDGNGTGIVGIGTGDGEPQTVPDVPPAPRPVKPATAVPQEIIEGGRIAGTKQILLPASVLTTLRNQGVSQVSARAQVCIDERGVPSSIGFRESSHYGEVDGVLAREMGKWRYRPYLVSGETVPACFIVTFRYRITD